MKSKIKKMTQKKLAAQLAASFHRIMVMVFLCLKFRKLHFSQAKKEIKVKMQDNSLVI